MQREEGESPELAGGGDLPTTGGGGASSRSSSLAAGLLGFEGEVREGGEEFKKGVAVFRARVKRPQSRGVHRPLIARGRGKGAGDVSVMPR